MYHFRQPQLQFIYLLNKINVNNSQLPDLRQLATIYQLNQLIYKTEPTRIMPTSRTLIKFYLNPT